MSVAVNFEDVAIIFGDNSAKALEMAKDGA